MMKFSLRIMLLLTIALLISCPFYGQSKTDTITLKKGEVFDILLLTQNSGVEAELKSYFQTALPVAKRMSYQSITGFNIINHTQGNIRPNSLILGKWSNLIAREKFLIQIIKEVPDFDEQRRKIWSFFGLRYFEINKNLSFKINRDKYHVATAYWLDSKYKSNNFFNQWKDEIKNTGGTILIQLKHGKSPIGYLYNPDFFLITSWENETDFKTFHEKTQKLKLDGIHHVNEFILE